MINSKGFTLIELVISAGIIAIICVAAFGLYVSAIKAVAFYRDKTIVSSLANQYLEVARNLPYSKVGTFEGNPPGSLPDLPNAINITLNGINYQIYYVVNALNDSLISNPSVETNPSVQDYKQVKLYVKNTATGKTDSFVTTIAPINTAQQGSGGGIKVQVNGKDGPPVSGATVCVQNTGILPNIDIRDRLTNSSGILNEVGLPPHENYFVSAIKAGYSSDKTYPQSQYPNATNPNPTVVAAQTQTVNFSVDPLSNLTFKTVDQYCQQIAGVGLNVSGAKTISPGVPKFNKNGTSDANGEWSPSSVASVCGVTPACSTTCGAASCCLEWDTYTPTLTSGQNYMIYGTSPVQSTLLLPNTSQNFNIIIGQKTNYSLYVVVTDATSGNPIEGAAVTLSSPGVLAKVKYTGGSIWSQSDWSGGPGQANWPVNVYSSNLYYQDDGNISTDVVPLSLRLKQQMDSTYVLSGTLTSSVFDTGTSTTHYTTLSWQSTEDQDTKIGFQIATSSTNDAGTVWNFKGPGGTSSLSDLYSVSGTSIDPANNNNRYVRYKVFLSTTNSSKTPMLSSVNINYVPGFPSPVGCPTPGQVMFASLSPSDNYNVTVSSSGYQTYTSASPLNISDSGTPNFILQVHLSQ